MTAPATRLLGAGAAHADGRVAGDRFRLELTASATADTQFFVYANRFRMGRPWRYTVAAGQTITETWPAVGCDLTVYGPRGFLRHFAGSGAGPEVTVGGARLLAAPGLPLSGWQHRVAGGQSLTIHNNSAQACAVTVRANRYRADGPWTHRLAAGSTVEHRLDQHWYDFTVSTEGFLRRLAGRLDDGPDDEVPGPLSAAVRACDSQETVGENGRAVNAVDGSAATIWHTGWHRGEAPLPHAIELDLGSARVVTGLSYLPRQDGGVNGRIGRYEVHVSTDGTAWGGAVASGAFTDDALEKLVGWTARTCRFVRLRALTEAGGRGPWTSAAGVTVVGW